MKYIIIFFTLCVVFVIAFFIGLLYHKQIEGMECQHGSNLGLTLDELIGLDKLLPTDEKMKSMNEDELKSIIQLLKDKCYDDNEFNHLINADSSPILKINALSSLVKVIINSNVSNNGTISNVQNEKRYKLNSSISTDNVNNHLYQNSINAITTSAQDPTLAPYTSAPDPTLAPYTSTPTTTTAAPYTSAPTTTTAAPYTSAPTTTTPAPTTSIATTASPTLSATKIAANNAVTAAKVEWEDLKIVANKAISAYDAAKQQFEIAKADYNNAANKYNNDKTASDSALNQYNNANNSLKTADASLHNAKNTLDTAKNSQTNAANVLTSKTKELTDAKISLDNEISQKSYNDRIVSEKTDVYNRSNNALSECSKIKSKQGEICKINASINVKTSKNELDIAKTTAESTNKSVGRASNVYKNAQTEYDNANANKRYIDNDVSIKENVVRNAETAKSNAESVVATAKMNYENALSVAKQSADYAETAHEQTSKYGNEANQAYDLVIKINNDVKIAEEKYNKLVSYASSIPE